MSALTFHFPPRTQWPGWEHAVLALQPYVGSTCRGARSNVVDPYASSSSTVPFDLAVVSTLGGTDYASDSPIFLATARGEDPAREYVVKMALRDDLTAVLVAEYTAYTSAVKSLQGGLVPICYGLFVSEQPARLDEPPEIGALVLSYAGTPPPVAFPFLPVVIKRKVLQALEELHNAGIVHRDLAERNILLEALRPDGNVSEPDDFNVHIIDFDAIEADHDCPGLSPEGGRRPCEQLTEVAEMFGLTR